MAPTWIAISNAALEPPIKIAGDDEVPRAADWQELRDPLDEAHEGRLEPGHVGSFDRGFDRSGIADDGCGHGSTAGLGREQTQELDGDALGGPPGHGPPDH